MIVEILVNAINKENPDPIINKRGCWKKGYPIVAKEKGWNWGRMECPPTFSKVTITDAPDLESITSYITPWIRKTAYEILQHDPLQDFFRVKIFSDPEAVGTNPDGQLLAQEMEDFLMSWGAEKITDKDGGVQFEITALDALNATGYLDYGPEEENVIYTEVDYEPVSGTHVILCDYSTSNITNQQMEQSLLVKKCVIVSHDKENKKITFEALRNEMIAFLEEGVRQKFEIMIGRTQYYFPSLIVDQGNVSMTFDEMKATMIDIREV